MRERNLVIWGLLGSLISGFDEFHIFSGLMNHDNNYVMKLFPWWFSPNYFIGGMLFYILFTLICNNCNWNQSPKFDWKRILCCFILLFTYPLSGYLCHYNQNDIENDTRFFIFNIVAIYIFILIIKIMKFEERIFSIYLYCFYATILGCLFEILNSMAPNSTFYHQPCFGESKHWTCEGFPIAIFWLPLLYLNIALIVPVFHL